ncbi:MFS general substrate transporter [Gymnopilus junonius]|uniref:MFS general substrate transporter n=1 Tax=Gymnopilus junonius TaxID=109634 RepID=A0A9P5NPF9_GYMJU|nr:MFS general substrate transporter [Gymnopilus junonius]
MPTKKKGSRAEDELEKEELLPEGTFWGWMSVVGGFCLSLSTFGFILSWSTFQAYYEQVTLNSSTPSDIAWIGSLQSSLIFLPGIVAGRLFDAGYFRHLLAIGSILFIVSNFLIAECNHYWQFLLCQGLALGLACGLIYVPCIACTSQWFRTKRPVAFSVMSVGVSVGGVIFPVMFKNLLPRFPWTLRAMGFINLVMFIVANMTMFTHLPPSNKTAKLLNFKGLFNAPFTFYIMGTFVSFLGLYTFLTFLGVSAIGLGFTTSQAFDLVAIYNAISSIGRFGSGILALKYGAVNTLIIFTSIAAICTYIWPSITSHQGLYAVTCIYGISSGAFVSLFPVGVASLGSVKDLGRRAGVLMSITAFGALAGPPISGAIVNHKHSFHLVGV